LIGADSSSLIAYLDGLPGDDTDAIDAALAVDELYLPPPVIIELLGGDDDRAYQEMIASASPMPIEPGFWLRARMARRLIRRKGLKARAIDSLIAQCCIDAGAPLIARDRDYRHFADWCGLKLA
jgi:hypothetical protein